MMIVVLVSRTPPRLAGLLTRWLLELQAGVYVGNVSATIRRGIWDRVLADVGKGHAVMVWPGRNDQGLVFVTHNEDWKIVDSDGLALVRRPTTDEALRRRALELYSGLAAPQINKDMGDWLRKHHPKARTPRKRTVPARLEAVRARHAPAGEYDEVKSMQEVPESR